MPYRRTMKRKSKAPKRYRKPGMRKRISSAPKKVHLFKRDATFTIYNTNVAGVPGTDGGGNVSLAGAGTADTGGGYIVPGAMSFHLDNLPSVSDFGNLYDRYKINGCRVRFIPLSNTASTGTTAILPTLYYVRDYDDDTVPTLAQLQQKQGVREVRLNRPVNIFLKPKVAQSLYASAIATGYSVPMKAPYINMTYQQVPHYGLKFAIRNLNLIATPTVQTTIRVEVTYFLSMKDPQ